MAPRLLTRGRLVALALALAAVVSSAVFAGTAQAAPPTPNFPQAIEPYAAYDPQNSCDPVAKPGAVGLRDLLNAAYGPHTSYFVIGCDSGGVSEHKEGRAPAFKTMDLGDINGDGYADLYALTNEGRQLVYMNRGGQGGDTTRFWAARDIGNAGFRVTQLANLNGDQYADLYGITDDHKQIIYMNRGNKQTDTEKFWAGRELGAAPGIKLAAL